MKKILFLLIASLFGIAAHADNNVSLVIQNLSKYNRTTSNVVDKYALLKIFAGDTISFELPHNYTHFALFTKEIPDTIWKKKRPKKNPVEGKHYILSYIYKGELLGKRFMTPASLINGKKFGVLSIDCKNSEPKGFIFKLIDLDDLSIVECTIPNYILFDIAIYSNKVDRLISSLKDNKVYINTGSSFSPKYIESKLLDGSYKLLFENSSTPKKLKSNFDLEFITVDGDQVPLTFDKDSYSSPSSFTDKIISEDEYFSNFVTHTITSDIDLDLACADIEKPFSFSYILGMPKNSTAFMSQTIEPSKANDNYWTKEYKRAPELVMFVAGTETVKGVQFYKMVYNDKAFFMKADDVMLTPKHYAKLDSLNNSPQEVKNYFFHHTLAFSQEFYYERIQETIDELESFKKYGLAIENWGVYDESRYTDGTGVNITFYNPTQQIIKYISFSFQGYNAVDDPYGGTLTKKCIGPIDPKEFASYQFEYVWFTDIVNYAKLRSITVTYKNGATKTISNPNTIIISNELREKLNSSNPVENFN